MINVCKLVKIVGNKSNDILYKDNAIDLENKIGEVELTDIEENKEYLYVYFNNLVGGHWFNIKDVEFIKKFDY